MSHYSFLIKPASSLCNMRCKYCFYADVSEHRTIKSFGVMQNETVDAILTQVFSSVCDNDSITFAFQGGEPTLAGLPFFDYFVKAATKAASNIKRISLDWALQTNGLLFDDEWCAFLAQHRFLVGISIDGGSALHDENRVDASDKGTFRRIMAAKSCLERHGVEYNVLCVLTNHLARFPQKIWTFIKEQKIQYIQFIPCLAGLDDAAPSRFALTPERFASFYTALYRLWVKDFEKGNYISIKLFDDICNLLARGRVSACGITGNCSPQFVIEADGSVYPCDFYVLDKWSTGNLTKNTVPEIIKNPNTEGFLHRPRTQSAVCPTCPYQKICGGGCPRMHSAMYLNGSFCGYRTFLNECGAQLQAIGQQFAK